MSVFRGSRTAVCKAEYVGGCVLITESDEENAGYVPAKRTPGRPPAFGWDAFHVEVASLIKSDQCLRRKRQRFSKWSVGSRARRRQEAEPLGGIGKAHPILSEIHVGKKLSFSERSKELNFLVCCPRCCPKLNERRGQKPRQNRHCKSITYGVPEEIRTPDPQISSLV